MYRTGSIRSWVGPAVMSTCCPSIVLGVKALSIASWMIAISGIRPLPLVPHAKGPSEGSNTEIFDHDWSVRMACCVAGFSHILSFIAGTMMMGLRAAQEHRVVVSASSAIPAAILPITLAVAGATTIRSAQSGREICSVLCSLMAANTFE